MAELGERQNSDEEYDGTLDDLSRGYHSTRNTSEEKKALENQMVELVAAD